MNKAGIKLISLGPKEGLALTNGASFSTALLALAVIDSRRVLFSNEIASSMTLDALLGVSAALDERIHGARPYPGQQAVAQRMRNLIAGSQLIDSTERVQDAYSLRLIADRSKIGLYSGLMMLHYTAGSLALENHALANPNSTSSVTTSSGQEDHNANATTAARNLRLVVENLTRIIAIELVCASQALELRMMETPKKSPGKGTLVALEHIRKSIDFIEHDRPYAVDINLTSELIQSGSLLTALHAAGFDDYAPML
jgi:histidine ammonia-lyase